MVPISLISGGSKREPSIVHRGRVLGVPVAKLVAANRAALAASAVATHREPDFDGLFSAWALNVLRGHPEAPIYSGKGQAFGIERRVPGLLSRLGIVLADISKMQGKYILLDAGAGSNRNVGATYEPDACIDTHCGAKQSRSASSIFSRRHAAVSTIITALIYREKGEEFFSGPLGRRVAGGLLLGIMTDCGMNNPTDYSRALYGTQFDIAAANFLRPRADAEVIGEYVSSRYWSRLDELTRQANAAVAKQAGAIKAFLIERLDRAESDMTGSVAESLLGGAPQALAVVCAAELVGGGLKVSFRLNHRHKLFSPVLVSKAIEGMVEQANAIQPGEASWRSEGRVLGGYWATKGLDEAKQVLGALIHQFTLTVRARGIARNELGLRAESTSKPGQNGVA